MRIFLFVFALFLGVSFGATGAMAAECKRPYHVLTKDGRCVWSCAKGTRPDAASGDCVCKPGLAQTSKDRHGRRICTAKVTGAKKKVKKYAKRNPFLTDKANLCARYDQFSEPDWPVKCATRRGRMQLSVLRPMEVVVRRNAPLVAEEFVPGTYQFSFARPANPPRNRNCDEALVGVPGACVPKCERMEMYTFFDDGNVASVRRPDHGDIGRCDGPVTVQYKIGRPTAARAWDACVDEAERRNLSGWGHDASFNIPRRFAVSFGFADARTVPISGGWRFLKKINYQFQERLANLPLVVHCRAN